MLFNKIILAARKLLGLSPGDGLDGLVLGDAMRRALERERRRADRSGTSLSIVAFSVSDSRTRAEAFRWLVKILKSRVRSTDEFGLLSSNIIGVLLVATPLDGARQFADDVRSRFPADVPVPDCTVYSYPSEEPSPRSAVSATNGTTNGKAHGGTNGSTNGKTDSTPVRTLAMTPLFERALPVWKRSLDVLLALFGLVLLFPLMVLIAVTVKLTSRGPVFFRQRRSGKGGRPFVMYKFRTMVFDAEVRKAALLALNEQDGPAFKLKHDPRVTRLGRFLRRTSLDELPQLWNVLIGDMTLVGPRPLPCEEASITDRWQRQRLDVHPGLTCIWQIWGRGTATFAEWVRMDVQYIRSRSIWHDLKLLLLTIPAVLCRRGAH